jgi:hypothetical protein
LATNEKTSLDAPGARQSALADQQQKETAP